MVGVDMCDYDWGVCRCEAAVIQSLIEWIGADGREWAEHEQLSKAG